MAFMEEQGMARTHRFSATDLIALSGVPRAFEIIDEAFESEVRAELESFAGNKISERRGYTLEQVRRLQRYIMLAPLHPSFGLYAFVGFQLSDTGGYPMIFVVLECPPNAEEKSLSISAMREIAQREGWEGHRLEDPSDFAVVERRVSLAGLLQEEDHIATVKRFFVKSLRQLGDELAAFKGEHPKLLWSSE